MLDGWMDVGWLEKAELKPTQPSLAGAWLSLAKYKVSEVQYCKVAKLKNCKITKLKNNKKDYKIKL